MSGRSDIPDTNALPFENSIGAAVERISLDFLRVNPHLYPTMRFSNWSTLSLLALALTTNSTASDDHAVQMAESLTIFKTQVRAALVENCVKCHGGEKLRSEYDITTREGLLAGGDIGVAVVSGDSKASPLMDYLTHKEEPYMPPKKPQLPAETIAAIAKWIDLGAAYDKPLVDPENAAKKDVPMQVTDAERKYWAFAPLRTDFPKDASIDSFVQAMRAEKKLAAAPPASKRTLIRRLYLDLTGLPPEPEAIDAFLADESPVAYEKLVDQLLASPRLGERWARHWLDVARFAESHGFEHDYDRKFAFHYRDFVIRAFNDDLPYDEFVRWQLAGDELAPENPLALMATGFLGAGVYPTQITISEAERIRYDAMDDMLATTGSAMLATTVGCARCHDHKYDPIPTRDYYQMLSAFKTTVRTEVDLDLSVLDRKVDDDYDKKHAALKAKMVDYRENKLPREFHLWYEAQGGKREDGQLPMWFALPAETLTSANGTRFEKLDDRSYLATGPNPDFDVYTLSAEPLHFAPTAIRIEALAHPSMVRSGPGRASNGNIDLTDLTLKSGDKELRLINPRATFQQNTGKLSVAASIDDDRKSGWAVDPQFGKDHAAIYEIANREDFSADKPLTFTLSFNGNNRHNIGRLRVAVTPHPVRDLKFDGQHQDPELLAYLEIQKIKGETDAGDLSKKQTDRIIDLFKAVEPEYQKLVGELAALEASRKSQMQKVMICSEGGHVKPMRHHTSSGKIPDFYKESYFLNRGDNKQKDGVAEPGFLQVLTRTDDTSVYSKAKPAESRTSGDRAALSRWITDPEHGAGHLLARVIVNRLWQHHFGRGIAATPNDFGFQGERPTHPELLDWLAGELIRNGWRLKHIHKLMLTSETYRMGGMDSSANQKIDPENHYHWYRPPRRLEAEAIRDSALAVGGMLDETMYGAGTLNENMRRRSIYFMVKRSKIVPMMQMFDWPDTLTSLGRRAVTTTPSQALVFINHPQFRQMAEGFAKRVASTEDPIVAAYEIAYGRKPTDIEHQRAVEFSNAQLESHKGDKQKALADLCAAILSANEFIYVE